MKIWIKQYYKDILFFIALIIVISSVILPKSLNDLDEIWNYSFAKNIADNLVPYKDFNMVPTPLLPLICGFFLKILGDELIVMRLLAILLISFLFFISYLILKKLKVNQVFAILASFFIFLLLKDYICIDYNFALLCVTLLIIYIEIIYFQKNNNYFERSKWFYFWIGILSGICILFKQTTGIFVSLVTVFYPILLLNNKSELKKYLKTSLFKILGIAIPVILLFIYLLLNNALYDFIDYTILGIKTFTNSIPYTSLIESSNIAIKLLSIFMPIFILVIGIYILIKKERTLFNFYCYGIASLVVAFPISDNIHFLIGVFPFIILLSYFSFIILKFILSKLQNKKVYYFIKEMSKCTVLLFLVYYLIYSFTPIASYFSDTSKYHSIEHYKLIPISESLLNKINTIDDYILSQNNKVYILDAEASIYMISINQYNKNYNLFNRGNLGSKGELGIIEEIKNFEPGTKLLIRNNNYSKNWQTPMDVINYIESNLTKVDEVSIFDVYEINNSISSDL